jgi:hypothetical protein
MKLRLSLAAGLAAVLLTASVAFAAEETWTGKISDSKCAAAHPAAEHGKKMSDAACTKACVKGGEKYVFVHEGKVLNIANQDFAGLPKHAGHTVSLTGELTGDTITVSKIAMPAKKATKAKATKTAA